MTVLEECLSTLEKGADWRIDLKTHDMWADGRHLVKGGQSELPLGVAKIDTPSALEKIEELFGKYYSSVPSERSEKRRRFFKAKRFEELTDEELMYGYGRDACQFMLEFTTLALILNGSLTWDDETMGGSWFWKSQRFPELIILKSWIEA